MIDELLHGREIFFPVGDVKKVLGFIVPMWIRAPRMSRDGLHGGLTARRKRLGPR